MLKNRDGTPYQAINAVAGMDLDDFFLHIVNEAHHAQAKVTGQVIGKAKYDEIIAFGLATNPVVLEV